MLKTFFIFRHQCILNIFDKDFMTMRFCKNCICFKKSCHINDEFEKCIKCVKTSRPCNLAFLNIWKYKKLDAKRKMLKKTFCQLHEKSSRILCELNEIKKKTTKNGEQRSAEFWKYSTGYCFFDHFWSSYWFRIWTNRVEQFDY